MTKDEVASAVESELAQHASTIQRLTVDEVRAIYAAEVEKYGAGRDAARGTRVEVSAALQQRNPPPFSHDVKRASGALTATERAELHDEVRVQVSDAHRILSDHARVLDPNHTDAHHFVQKLHGIALWREVDRAIAEAGIGGAS
jgi:hypothetical protein